ncbi:AlpA family phage regulatory protein [Mesosutterella sp. OilRF-GAM-744-9]|uniref:AlpA family phage regulatory protein n=1 Tax=Mesosutterella porci TaxID=2915351 RepID=A0ABS9MTX1_9BURK|nr:AlpA family phage regulatory protein [Mesosutterella sp. oilRF-744-WT-GAM-9]MCG5031867.1 AlpA family phage regulatory protein [Mesosutterella sp. oilRF-744-WT-GAM-9]
MSSTEKETQEPKLLTVRMKDLSAAIGLSPSTIFQYVHDGKFPKPIKINPRVSLWKWSEVEAWLDQQAKKQEGK